MAVKESAIFYSIGTFTSKWLIDKIFLGLIIMFTTKGHMNKSNLNTITIKIKYNQPIACGAKKWTPKSESVRSNVENDSQDVKGRRSSPIILLPNSFAYFINNRWAAI